MRKILLLFLICLMVLGCTGNKESAFVIREAFDDPILLQCYSGREATCPDSGTGILQIMMHADDLRQAIETYRFNVDNFNDEYPGCLIADIKTHTVPIEMFDHTEITYSTIIAMIEHINVFTYVPIRNCYSTTYQPTGFRYVSLQDKSVGSQIVRLRDVEWEHDIKY